MTLVARDGCSRYTHFGSGIAVERPARRALRLCPGRPSVRRISRTPILLLVLLALGLGGLLSLRLYMGREAEDRLDEADVVDFADLASAPPTHRFLMCPDGQCSQPADAKSPVFACDWERLRDDWTEVVAHQANVKLLSGDGELEKIVYVQHSPILRLPEIVTIEFFPLGEHAASFAIESHSRYGWIDFGGNKARVLGWVALLERVAKQRHDA